MWNHSRPRPEQLREPESMECTRFSRCPSPVKLTSTSMWCGIEAANSCARLAMLPDRPTFSPLNNPSGSVLRAMT